MPTQDNLFQGKSIFNGNDADNIDELFKLALNERNQELTASIIDKSFNTPLLYVDQKENYLLRYATQFVDKVYQSKLDEIKCDDLIEKIGGYYSFRALLTLKILLPQMNQEQLQRILNRALAKGIFFITKKEFNEFKTLLVTFLKHLTDSNREFFLKTWQQKDASEQMQSLLHDLKNASVDDSLPKKPSTIEDLFQKLKDKNNPFKYLNKLRERASELTQEQLLDFVKSDVPHMERAEQRTHLLAMLDDFAKYLDPEHQEHMRNYVRELLTNQNEQCFTIARIIAPYLTADDVDALIDFAKSKLSHRYKYKAIEDWSAYRFIDFTYTLDVLKNKIPASKSLDLFNMFKAMVENNGYMEYAMNHGLHQSVRQLGQYFNEEILSLFVKFVKQCLKLPEQDNSFLDIILQVLIDVIPRLTNEQFAKLFSFQNEILFKLHRRFRDEIAQTYIDTLAFRLSTQQAAAVKEIMINIFNHNINEILFAAQQSKAEVNNEKLIITDGQENTAQKIEIYFDEKAAESICHYVLMFGKVARYFDHQDVKRYLQVSSQFYQFMTEKQIKMSFHLIPELYQHADEEDRRTLYHFMSICDEKYLYSSFDVVKKICNQLPYDLLQHYLERLMAVKAPYEEAHVPCNDTIPVLFKMIPLLNGKDNLKLLDYLIKQAHTQDHFDLSDLILQMLKHNKCNMDDLAKTDILSLEWGVKMIKVVTLYQQVALTNCHFTLFKTQQISKQLLDGAEEYKRDIEKDMLPPTRSFM